VAGFVRLPLQRIVWHGLKKIGRFREVAGFVRISLQKIVKQGFKIFTAIQVGPVF
jgi:hypothetical protein